MEQRIVLIREEQQDLTVILEQRERTILIILGIPEVLVQEQLGTQQIQEVLHKERQEAIQQEVIQQEAIQQQEGQRLLEQLMETQEIAALRLQMRNLQKQNRFFLPAL